MKQGERIWLEIDIDSTSFRVTDRASGIVVMSVSAGSRGLPLHLYTQIRDLLTEIVSSYLANVMQREE